MTLVSVNKLVRKAKLGIATGSISLFLAPQERKREIHLPDYPNHVNVMLTLSYSSKINGYLYL
jgi:hypothetical protein